jgi:ankyrin repeat protein
MREDNYEMIRWALLLGAAGSCRNPRNHSTPISHALEHRDVLLLRWILLRGGDPNEVIVKDVTPIDDAVNTAQYEAVEVLLRAGAGANDIQPDRSSCTPLMRAAASPDPAMATALCRLLLRYGADRSARDEDVAMSRLFLGYGAGRSAGDEKSVTASDIAARLGRVALAAELRP